MGIAAEDVKRLRDMTGAGMMAAKNALVEAGGDMVRAQEILRLAGQAGALKKAEREAKNGLIESYVHSGRIGVLVEINCETDFVARTDDFKQFAHDVAMQVAAASPAYINPEDVPEEVVEKEKELYWAELEGSQSAAGKPDDIKEQIVMGKLDQYYAAVALMRQPFVKAPDKTIEALTKELIAKVGENIVIRRMVRIELGETA